MIHIGASVAEHGIEESVRRSLADNKLCIDLLRDLIVERIENKSIGCRIYGTERCKQITVNLVLTIGEFVVLVLFADCIAAVRRNNGKRSLTGNVVCYMIEDRE